MNVKRLHEPYDTEDRSPKRFGTSLLTKDHDRSCGSATSLASAGMGACPPAWGCQAHIGHRATMEDRYASGRLNWASPNPSLACYHFSLFDGHGGCKVSEFLAENVGAYIERALLVKRTNGQSTLPPSHIAAALRDAFLSLDRDLPTRASKEIGGATAICLVINDSHLIVASCGDSRAVLSRSDGITPLSDDHKPERTDEEARIRAAGGRIIHNGGARVMGVLNMTRAIGDTLLQKFGVSPEPEIMIVERSSAGDDFIIIASDGLWGSMSNQEAVNIVQRCLERAAAKGVDRAAATRIAAKVLVHAAMRLGSRDNITVMVVDVQLDQAAPSPTTPDQSPPVLLSCVDSASPPGAVSPQQPSPAPAAAPQLPQVLESKPCPTGSGLLSAENLLLHMPAQEGRTACCPPPAQLWCSCEAVPNCCNGASSCLVDLPAQLQSTCCPSSQVAASQGPAGSLDR